MREIAVFDGTMCTIESWMLTLQLHVASSCRTCARLSMVWYGMVLGVSMGQAPGLWVRQFVCTLRLFVFYN